MRLCGNIILLIYIPQTPHLMGQSNSSFLKKYSWTLRFLPCVETLWIHRRKHLKLPPGFTRGIGAADWIPSAGIPQCHSFHLQIRLCSPSLPLFPSILTHCPLRHLPSLRLSPSLLIITPPVCHRHSFSLLCRLQAYPPSTALTGKVNNHHNRFIVVIIFARQY